MLESLCTIKSDLEQTAAHLERLSVAISGHLIFLNKRGGHVDGLDVKNHILSIDSSASYLRNAASGLDASVPADVEALRNVVLLLRQEAAAEQGVS